MTRSTPKWYFALHLTRSNYLGFLSTNDFIHIAWIFSLIMIQSHPLVFRGIYDFVLSYWCFARLSDSIHVIWYFSAGLIHSSFSVGFLHNLIHCPCVGLLQSL